MVRSSSATKARWRHSTVLRKALRTKRAGPAQAAAGSTMTPMNQVVTPLRDAPLHRSAHEREPGPVPLDDPTTRNHLIANRDIGRVPMIGRSALPVVVQAVDRNQPDGTRAIGKRER